MADSAGMDVETPVLAEELSTSTNCCKTHKELSESTTTDSETDYTSASFLERERLIIHGFEAVEDEEDASAAGEDEVLDLDSLFAEFPQTVGEDDRLEMLGIVSGLAAPSLAIVVPQDASLVIDVGAAVVSGRTRDVCGAVWDLFGPISAPMYAVAIRQGHASEFAVGEAVRFSRNAAILVSTESLRNERGTDADPGVGEEFSDDEAERVHRRGLEPGEL